MSKKLMGQTEAEEISAIGKEVFLGKANRDLERGRLVILFDDNSRAVRLFDYVAAQGKLPKFVMLDIPDEVKRALVIVISCLAVAAAILYLIHPETPVGQAAKLGAVVLLQLVGLSWWMANRDKK